MHTVSSTATTLAERGHEVHLYEATRRLGGQVAIAATAPHRSDIGAITEWLTGEVERLGVHIRLNTMVDPDVVADLATYSSTTEGIFLRGVIEHNEQWRDVLTNALRSAAHRLFLAVFTPEGRNEEIGRTPELDVPDLALSSEDIDAVVAAEGWTVTSIVPTRADTSLRALSAAASADTTEFAIVLERD
jgi:hypothetical protein